MSEKIDELIHLVRVNLQQLIHIADEISQEFRRTIHMETSATGKSGRNVKLLKKLFETDNLIRDTIAQLKQASSRINFNADQYTLLKNEEFLAELYSNLSQMFKSLEDIYEVMEFEQAKVDDLVIDTIDSLDRLKYM